MFGGFRFRSLVLVLGLVLVLSALPVQANNAWGPYHWARTSNPFTVKLGDNVSNTWDPILATTSSDWSASNVMDTPIVGGGTKPRSCRPTEGQVEVCSARYGNTGWLGVAQIWITGGEHIVQCTAKVNDYYHDNPPYNSTAWRNLVMCQEVGHCFGLDHQDENFNNPNLGTCMDYTSNPEGPPSNEHPNAHDYQQLEIIYEHLDDFTTLRAAQSMPQAMRVLELSDAAQWGELVRVGNNGNTALFELDFGGGNKVLTFVILTLPDAAPAGNPVR